MRSPRYKVCFAYMTKPKIIDGIEETRYGVQEPRLMNGIDLEYMLKILNPLKCGEWLNNLSFLRRGGNMVFELDSFEEGGYKLKKIVKIERN